MSAKDEQLAELIASIYEAAMHGDAWPGLLQQLAAFMESDAAVFRISDVVSDKALQGYTWGHDESYLRKYRDEVIHNDPYRPVLKRLPAGKFYPGQAAFHTGNWSSMISTTHCSGRTDCTTPWAALPCARTRRHTR